MRHVEILEHGFRSSRLWLIGQVYCLLKPEIICKFSICGLYRDRFLGGGNRLYPRLERSELMRVALIVVSMLVVTTPSQASKSCMSKAEARQNLGSVHIYWHGKDHCWDATGTRRLVHNVRPRRQIQEVRRTVDQPKWQESMSQMLADDEPAQTNPQTSWINRWVEIDPPRPTADARQVDIAAVVLPSIESTPAPMVSPHVILLVFITIVIALTLATIEFMFRRAVY